ERAANLLDCRRPLRWLDRRPGSACEFCTGAHEQRKRQEELYRCSQPKPISRRCAVSPQGERQHPHRAGENGRLPEVVRQRRKIRIFHCDLSFLRGFWRAFSASLMSFRVSSPDSTRCAITSFARPPNTASRSSTKRRCASLREITASKMFALLIRFTQ